jgi:hypothetical protein
MEMVKQIECVPQAVEGSGINLVVSDGAPTRSSGI